MEPESPLLASERSSSSSAAKRPVLLSKSVSSCILAEGASAAKSLEYRSTQRKLAFAIVLAFMFMIVEVVGGLYAHSLAIITDAAHLLSDVSGFAVSLFAAIYAARRSKEHFSYGYHRVEVLGALASVLTVWLVTGILLFEAVNRVINPQPVNGKVMFILAMTGVGVNLLLVAILGGHHHHHGHDHDHDHSHSHHSHSHGVAHSHSRPQISGGGSSRPPLLDTVPESPGRERQEAPAEAAPAPGVGPTGDLQHGQRQGKEGGRDVEEGGMTHGDHHGDCRADGHHHHGSADDHSHHSHGQEQGHKHAAGECGPSHNHDHGHGGCGGEGGPDRRNINMRGAVVHVIGDLLQSIGVAVAGALIWYNQDDPRWYLADPICTFLFAALVMWSTAAIVRDISDVLMERVPRGLSIASIHSALSRIPGVEEVHDLHVWSLTPGIPLLCSHINLDLEADPTDVLHAINNYCRSLGIEHSTVQLVVNGRVCPCVEGEGAANGQH